MAYVQFIAAQLNFVDKTRESPKDSVFPDIDKRTRMSSRSREEILMDKFTGNMSSKNFDQLFLYSKAELIDNLIGLDEDKWTDEMKAQLKIELEKYI